MSLRYQILKFILFAWNRLTSKPDPNTIVTVLPKIQETTMPKIDEKMIDKPVVNLNNSFQSNKNSILGHNSLVQPKLGDSPQTAKHINQKSMCTWESN